MLRIGLGVSGGSVRLFSGRIAETFLEHRALVLPACNAVDCFLILLERSINEVICRFARQKASLSGTILGYLEAAASDPLPILVQLAY